MARFILSEDYVNCKRLNTLSNPSDLEFNKNYGTKNIPVLLTDMMTDWRALDSWTYDFFRNTVGDFEEDAQRCYDASKMRKFKVAEYFDYMETSSDLDPYYLKLCQFHLKSNMKNDYNIPMYFDSYLKFLATDEVTSQLSWLYIGAANTFSGLHIDIFNTSAWNALVSGRKFWCFYSPDQIEYLYDGAVNPFIPNFTQFPKFKDAQPLICVQNPGDIVFTPSGWWHAVYNEENSVALTENFVNESNYENVREALLYSKKTDEVKDLDNCKKMYHNMD